ncbi:hypothetical protein [Clostridium rectalis]|uniref:hypothetical protein n=1 Tax=Clostridium rectalis TaxID=2040295 RepID=UPI000F63F8D3|nr:hypothetical protein [Clostridium rectalis]
MNCFLEREIKSDLDLIKRHIKKVEYELLTFDMETYYPEEFIHLYEIYQRLMRIYTDNYNSAIENALNFYIKRRNVLYRIKYNLKNNMNSLFNGNRKNYKKLIYTYENIIREYKDLYESIRNIQIDKIKKLFYSEIKKIDHIELKDIETLKEIIDSYNKKEDNIYSCKDKNINFINYINKLELDFVQDTDLIGLYHYNLICKGRYIPIRFNKDIEFNIVFKN